MEPTSQDRLSEAISHLEQAVRQAPGNPRYTATLGEAWLLRGDPEAALAPLQSSFATGPMPRTACLLAQTLHALGRDSEAETFAGAAIEDGAGFHRAYAIRAEIRRRRGNLTGALDDFEAACALAPDHPEYRVRRDETERERRARAPVAPTQAIDLTIARTEGHDLSRSQIHRGGAPSP